MKILVISNVFPPGFIGGYELGAKDVVEGLARFGHVVKVLTSNYFLDDEVELPALDVSRAMVCSSISHDYHSKKSSEYEYHNGHNLRLLGSTVRTFKPDVVLLFNIHGLAPMSLLRYLQAIEMPTILYLMDNVFQGLDVSGKAHIRYEKTFGPFAFGPQTQVIAMSKNVSREVETNLALTLHNVTYIPGWVDFVNYNGRTAPPSEDGSTIRFVFCSRVAAHKGIDLLVDATERLVKGGINNFVVDVYGDGQVPALIHSIRTKNLQNIVRYRGSIAKHEVLGMLSGYDALIFPTWEREAFGFIASESAAAGCVPILTAGIGASEWFLDGYDCLKISRDVEALTGAMKVILFSSSEGMQKLKNATTSTAQRSFSFSKWIAVIENVCVKASNRAEMITPHDTRGVERSLQYLNEMFNTSN